jgi:outer membrane protein assembly factor BamB
MPDLTIPTRFGELTIIDDRTHSFGSADNVRCYPKEIMLCDAGVRSSVHGVLIDGEPLIVFGASGGASAMHAHSALVIGERLYLAVGDSVVCFDLERQALTWSTRVDSATCFGVYHEPARCALIAHGELEISRISLDGYITWQRAGADIFSGDILLEPDAVWVTDFDGRLYRFSYETGARM